MSNYYKKNFATNSPIFLFFLICTLVLGFIFRQNVPMPSVLANSHVEALSRFGLSKDFIVSASNFFCWVEFLLSMCTIVLLYFLGKFMVGKTAGICSAFTFAVYPYFVANLYTLNIFLILSFVLYLLFMYIGLQSASITWNLVSGIFFMLACIMEPSLIFLGLFPYIYFLIKQKHIAILNSFLFFLIGIIGVLGFCTLTASLKGNLSSFFPIDSAFLPLTKGLKTLFSHPLIYCTETIWPYLKNTFAEPLVAGTYSYLHYFIVTLSILGILYSFVHENVRILSILFVVMLLQALFMPYNYSILLITLVILASFMIDKVTKDVFQL